MIETQLKDFIILDAIGDKKNEYDKKREKIEFINSIFEKIGQMDYTNIDYVKLGRYIDKGNECQEIRGYEKKSVN